MTLKRTIYSTVRWCRYGFESRCRQDSLYYDTLTEPSDDKETRILIQRDEIKYESTGKANLTKDVKAFFQKFKAMELKIQDHVKLESFQTISKCSKILAKSIPALRTVINSLPLSTRIYSFDQFCKQGCF